MKKCLITGASGFVARHLIHHLLSSSGLEKIVGVDLRGPSDFFDNTQDKCVFRRMNLLDRDAFNTLIMEEMPDSIIHLASYSSVSFSWENPAESFLNNTSIFLNIMDSVRLLNPSCKVLSIGSSEVYGKVFPANLPLREESMVYATSPYGAGRISQEMLSRVYSEGYGVDIVMTRSFNHFGPFQGETFVIADFVRQFVTAELLGKKVFELLAGDIDVIRDFTDVRDIVGAYILLLERGRSGEIYNVCSGRGMELKAIIDLLGEITGLRPIVVRDAVKIRPVENPIIVGDESKIRNDCGWFATTSFETGLRETVAYWRNILVAEGRS